MSIMIAAKAASSTEGANHDYNERKRARGSLLTLGERRNYGVMKSRHNGSYERIVCADQAQRRWSGVHPSYAEE